METILNLTCKFKNTLLHKTFYHYPFFWLKKLLFVTVNCVLSLFIFLFFLYYYIFNHEKKKKTIILHYSFVYNLFFVLLVIVIFIRSDLYCYDNRFVTFNSYKRVPMIIILLFLFFFFFVIRAIIVAGPKIIAC